MLLDFLFFLLILGASTLGYLFVRKNLTFLIVLVDLADDLVLGLIYSSRSPVASKVRRGCGGVLLGVVRVRLCWGIKKPALCGGGSLGSVRWWDYFQQLAV